MITFGATASRSYLAMKYHEPALVDAHDYHPSNVHAYKMNVETLHKFEFNDYIYGTKTNQGVFQKVQLQELSDT